jgi:hypothetical protein
MTAVDTSGSARPARVAGLVLLGVAVIALIIGIITLFGGNGSNGNGGTAQPPPPNTTATQPPTSGTAPPTNQPPPTSPGSPAPSSPPASQPGTGTPAPPPPSTKAQPVRVFNNSTITGLAARAADDFRAQGWDVVEVGNYAQGVIPTSTAYFRSGTEEEPAARELGAAFGLRTEPRFPGIQNANVGVIVIVTNDYGK